MSQPNAQRAAPRRILIVDDERAIRELLENMLRRRQYDVVAALAPGAALPWIAEPEHDVDLLITDISMPDINGRDLAERLRQRHPTLPVIFISGYADVQSARLPASERERFLAKPFKLADLFAAIESLLGPA
jgi:two-component system, cell cycle sensor histidine kinase and response regulator CckA